MIFDKDKGNPMEERQPFQQMVLKKNWTFLGENKNLDLNLLPYKKLNSKCIKTIKPLKKKKKKSLGPRAKQRILRLDNKTKPKRGKKDKLNIDKIQNYCPANDPIQIMKNQATD